MIADAAGICTSNLLRHVVNGKISLIFEKISLLCSIVNTPDSCIIGFLIVYFSININNMNMKNVLTFDNLEKIKIGKPVYRVPFMSDLTIGKTVLDIGCYDETAQVKINTEHFLHDQIVKKAKKVVGIDNSNLLPPQGIKDGENSYIYRSDATDIPAAILAENKFDVVIAGEFIEHIENHMIFFRYLKDNLKNCTIAISTPNGMAFSNFLMGMIRKEVQHPDHLHFFSYKILYTVCTRAGFTDFEIIPYYFYATEMILKSKGLKRFIVKGIEKFIRVFEWCFPLNCMGYIVVIKN
jgi:methyltransferase family protein